MIINRNKQYKISPCRHTTTYTPHLNHTQHRFPNKFPGQLCLLMRGFKVLKRIDPKLYYHQSRDKLSMVAATRDA